MIKLIRTDSANSDFSKLVQMLDKVLEQSDGDEHPFYAQFNTLDKIPFIVVAYSDNKPAGCGAIRKYSEEIAEIKRMYVAPEFRGQGIARKILAELELWAEDLNFSECILETGKKQTEAVELYLSSHYQIIPNYDPYAGAENSVCMKKIIKLS